MPSPKFDNLDRMVDDLFAAFVADPESPAGKKLVMMGRNRKGPLSDNLSRKPSYWVVRRLWAKTDSVTEPEVKSRLRALWRQIRAGRKPGDDCWPWEIDEAIAAFLTEPSELPDILQRLSTGDTQEKIAALRALAALGEEARPALPALLEALNDPTVIEDRDAGFNVNGYRYTYVRFYAVVALSRVAPVEAAAPARTAIAELSQQLQYRDTSGGDPFCPTDQTVQFSREVLDRFAVDPR